MGIYYKISTSLLITGAFDGIGTYFQPGIAKISLGTFQAALDTSFTGGIYKSGLIRDVATQEDKK